MREMGNAEKTVYNGFHDDISLRVNLLRGCTLGFKFDLTEETGAQHGTKSWTYLHRFALFP